MAVRWVTGAVGSTLYPTDGKGGSTATATSSALHGVKSVKIVGVLISTFDATTVVEIVDSAGTAITGLGGVIGSQGATFSIRRDIGVFYEHATNANIGIKLTTGTGVASLLYEP
jgi:hypothetical protein